MQSLRTALGKSVIHFLISKDKTNSVEHIYQVVRPFLNGLWVQKLSSWIHICRSCVWLNVCLWCRELPLSLRPPCPLGQLLLVLQLNPCASKQWPLESDISPWDTQILPSKHSHNTTSTSLWGKKTNIYLSREPCFPNGNKFISPPRHSHSCTLCPYLSQPPEASRGDGACTAAAPWLSPEAVLRCLLKLDSEPCPSASLATGWQQGFRAGASQQLRGQGHMQPWFPCCKAELSSGGEALYYSFKKPLTCLQTPIRKATKTLSTVTCTWKKGKTVLICPVSLFFVNFLLLIDTWRRVTGGNVLPK